MGRVRHRITLSIRAFRPYSRVAPQRVVAATNVIGRKPEPNMIPNSRTQLLNNEEDTDADAGHSCWGAH